MPQVRQECISSGYMHDRMLLRFLRSRIENMDLEGSAPAFFFMAARYFPSRGSPDIISNICMMSLEPRKKAPAIPWITCDSPCETALEARPVLALRSPSGLHRFHPASHDVREFLECVFEDLEIREFEFFVKAAVQNCIRRIEAEAFVTLHRKIPFVDSPLQPRSRTSGMQSPEWARICSSFSLSSSSWTFLNTHFSALVPDCL